MLLSFYAVGAPHSIWVAQASSLLMFLLWSYRWLILKKVSSVKGVPGFYPLIGFFGLAFLSALFSFEPRLSLNGMRSVLFMGMFVVVARALSRPVTAVFLMGLMVVSAQANVLETFSQEVRGIGFRMTGFTDDSPFKGKFEIGDVLFLANGKRVQSPTDIFRIACENPIEGTLRFEGRRIELRVSGEIPVRSILEFGKKDRTLGVLYQPARDFRAKGFFDHYATYAEVLQLLISMALGLWISALKNPRIRLWLTVFIGTMVAALWFTYTRAPQAGLMVSVLVIGFAAIRFKLVRVKINLVWLTVVLVCGGVALGFAYSTRGIGVGDSREGSLFWRLVVWQEGVELVKRHPLLGIGRGSDKIHAFDWGLYAAGDLPPGHFHNTFLQIAVWYGIPALLVYGLFLITLFSGLWRGLKAAASRPQFEGSGVILGALGGLSGFCVSSMVHFNLGDGEVAMTLWLILGCAFAVTLSESGKKGFLRNLPFGV